MHAVCCRGKDSALADPVSLGTAALLGAAAKRVRRRLASAENKRQAQEGRFDGLEDERLRLSGELLLLKRYADDVRRRLLEKEALVADLESRLRISTAPGTET